MIVRQLRNQRRVVAPSYHLDLTTDRLTIHVPDTTLLDLVPDTIRRATTRTERDQALTVIIDCRRSPAPPALPDICRLAESLADSWDINGPVALVAPGVDDVATFALGVFVSARAETTLRVFSDASRMETFLRHAPVLT
jgi:hypothetical protein